jgi:hypothetical protein
MTDAVLETKNFTDFRLVPSGIRTGNIPQPAAVLEITPGESYMPGDTYRSNILWEKSINSLSGPLADWGLCSTDNGFTSFNRHRDRIEDIFRKTVLSIPQGERRFFMRPVSGMLYDDPPVNFSVENTGNEISFKSGFLQGFYRLTLNPLKRDETYSTLPDTFRAWKFIIRPRPGYAEREGVTLNSLYPDNSGIFYYRGTRAENKWWYFTLKIKKNLFREFQAGNRKEAEDFLGEYIDTTAFLKSREGGKNRHIENFQTSDGILLNTPNIIEFESDNKYLMFNRTECGVTAADFKDGEAANLKTVISYRRKNRHLNYYLLFNRTENGLTTVKTEPCRNSAEYGCNTYLQYNLCDKKEQQFPERLRDVDLFDSSVNIFDSIAGNNFAFRITPDGRIGYRFISPSCDDENGEETVTVTEEYSGPQAVKNDRWNTIDIKFIPSPHSDSRQPYGRLYFYRDSKPVFVSGIFKQPSFTTLDEHYSKQLGVPFNISLGGGTQGLMESILSQEPDEYVRYVLPLQKYFAGTFYGDIKLFQAFRA